MAKGGHKVFFEDNPHRIWQKGWVKGPDGKKKRIQDSKDYARFRETGWTRDDFEAAWLAQDGKCAICKYPTSKEWNGKNNSACADHCHITLVKRQLLCNRCNRGLGMFLDNPALLEAAAAYLRKYPPHLISPE